MEVCEIGKQLEKVPRRLLHGRLCPSQQMQGSASAHVCKDFKKIYNIYLDDNL